MNENRVVQSLMSLCPSIICKLCTTEGFRRSGKAVLFWEVDMPSAACLKQKLVRLKLFWNEGRREDKPEDLMDALPYADEDISKHSPTNFN